MADASPHTLVAKFKPKTFGPEFVLYHNGIGYGSEPSQYEQAGAQSHWHQLAGVITCTLGANSTTIEIKKTDAVTWTFGVVKISRLHRAKASAFKTKVDNAVAAYVAPTGPAITSVNSLSIAVGVAGSKTITTTGSPLPAFWCTGALPSGVHFVDHNDGTAVLSGTPAAGTAAVYPLVITAYNGTTPNATQNFTLTITA